MTTPRKGPATKVPVPRPAGPAAGGPTIPPQPAPPLIYWKPLAAAVVFMLAFVIGATAAVTRSRPANPGQEPNPADVVDLSIPPPPPIVARLAAPLREADAKIVKAGFKAGQDLRAELAAAKPDPLFGNGEPLPEPAPVAALAPAPRVDDKESVPALAGKETFGTAVAFERNMTEAAKLAMEQRKLLFLLHVSGNFEEQEFT